MTKILLVGCGKMGGAILQSLQKHSGYDITIVGKEDKIVDDVKYDFIIFAVKPLIIGEIIYDYANIAENAVVISIIAGKKMQFFADHLRVQQKIIRIMPNLPSAIGEGMSVAIANEFVSNAEKDTAQQILESIGKVMWLDDENLIDSATGISGSGPAYFFYFMQKLIEAGVKQGLTIEQSKALVMQTAKGSVKLAEDNSLTDLMKNVASPKGTTEAALEVLTRDHDFADIIGEAVEKAVERAKELSS
jgi:pyrroline-5-carboxylate reductase